MSTWTALPGQGVNPAIRARANRPKREHVDYQDACEMCGHRIKWWAVYKLCDTCLSIPVKKFVTKSHNNTSAKPTFEFEGID